MAWKKFSAYRNSPWQMKDLVPYLHSISPAPPTGEAVNTDRHRRH